MIHLTGALQAADFHAGARLAPSHRAANVPRGGTLIHMNVDMVKLQPNRFFKRHHATQPNGELPMPLFTSTLFSLYKKRAIAACAFQHFCHPARSIDGCYTANHTPVTLFNEAIVVLENVFLIRY